MPKPLPSFEEVSELLRLDSETGKLFRKVRTSNRIKVGDEAGTLDGTGYIHIRIFGIVYQAHRIVLLLHTGKCPVLDVDHINGIKNDNRPLNLREVSRGVNLQNQKKPNKGNRSTSTVPGCFWLNSKQTWIAKCAMNHKTVLERTFRTQLEAEACVLEFRSKNFTANTLPSSIAEHYMAINENN